MALFLKNVAFHGILLDALFEEGNREWEEVSQLLKRGIEGGVVKPLRTTVFERDQVEEAFRYMAQGKHIGKVLLQVTYSTTPLLSYSFTLYFSPSQSTAFIISSTLSFRPVHHLL